jgi:hypothetical protein
MLRGTTDAVIAENVRLLKSRGHDHASATKHAHAHAKTHAEHGMLTTKARAALHDSAFALPGRRYPIHDAAHAKNALARVSQFGTHDEKTQVRSAVHRRFPAIGKDA